MRAVLGMARERRTFLLSFFLSATSMGSPRICLNMIVKDESPVIQRCLASVKPWIDHWVIVDTGSSDGTQDLVRAAVAGVPGSLHERRWRDFAHNRNEALALARAHADYVLLIDADEQLIVPAGFQWPSLASDGYLLECVLNGWSYGRNSLIATRLDWRWVGVLHEFLTCDVPHRWELLPGPKIDVGRDGARARDPSTYLKDVDILRKALEQEPGNTRYTFYLAQTYRDAGLIEESVRCYQQRVALEGWDEERWFAAFQVAVLGERLQWPTEDVQQAYLAAYALRPSRAEPLCELARCLRLRGDRTSAFLYAARAAAMRAPPDVLFVDTSVYAWRALDELASTAWYAGARDEGRQAVARLLAEQRFPASERERIEANARFYA